MKCKNHWGRWRTINILSRGRGLQACTLHTLVACSTEDSRGVWTQPENILLLQLFWGQEKVMECWSFFSLKPTKVRSQVSQVMSFSPAPLALLGCAATEDLTRRPWWKSNSRSHISPGKAQHCGPRAREPEPSRALAAVVLGGRAGGGR